MFLYNGHPSNCEVVSVYISLYISDVEHLFIYLVTMCMSLEKCLFKFFCPFLNYLFLLLSCLNSLYILNINPLSDIWFANIFFHSIGCFFTWLIFFLLHGSFLVWCICTCLFLLLLPDFWCHIQEIIIKTNVIKLFSYIFSRSFIVPGFMFKSLIHFELIFVYGVI